MLCSHNYSMSFDDMVQATRYKCKPTLKSGGSVPHFVNGGMKPSTRPVWVTKWLFSPLNNFAHYKLPVSCGGCCLTSLSVLSSLFNFLQRIGGVTSTVGLTKGSQSRHAKIQHWGSFTLTLTPPASWLPVTSDNSALLVHHTWEMKRQQLISLTAMHRVTQRTSLKPVHNTWRYEGLAKTKSWIGFIKRRLQPWTVSQVLSTCVRHLQHPAASELALQETEAITNLPRCLLQPSRNCLWHARFHLEDGHFPRLYVICGLEGILDEGDRLLVLDPSSTGRKVQFPELYQERKGVGQTGIACHIPKLYAAYDVLLEVSWIPDQSIITATVLLKDTPYFPWFSSSTSQSV